MRARRSLVRRLQGHHSQGWACRCGARVGPINDYIETLRLRARSARNPNTQADAGATAFDLALMRHDGCEILPRLCGTGLGPPGKGGIAMKIAFAVDLDTGCRIGGLDVHSVGCQFDASGTRIGSASRCVAGGG